MRMFGSPPTIPTHSGRMRWCRPIGKKSVSHGRGGAGVSPPPGFVLDVAPGDAKADSVVPAAATGSVVPAVDTASCDCGNKCVGLDWDSSSGDDGAYHASSRPAIKACLHLRSRAAFRRRRLWTAGCRRPRLSCRQHFSWIPRCLGPGQRLVAHSVYQKWLDIFPKARKCVCVSAAP